MGARCAVINSITGHNQRVERMHKGSGETAQAAKMCAAALRVYEREGGQGQ